MELKWLDDYIALIETGSFSAAAERRHVSQPAFSRRIQMLEAWLGVTLIDRTRKPLQFTPVCSREPGWAGAQGHVQDQALPDALPDRVYACGNPAMIDAARARFLTRGLPSRHFHSDAFVASMEAAHEAAGSIAVRAALLTAEEARALAGELLAKADRIDGRHFEVVDKDDDWDPQP